MARPAACAGLSFIYFFTNVLCLYADQSSFWKERQKAVQKLQNQSDFAETIRSMGQAVPEQHPRTNISAEQSKLLAQLPQTANFDLGTSNNVFVTHPVLPSFTKGGLGRIINNPPPSPFSKGGDRGNNPTLFNQILPYGDIRDVYISRNPNSPLIIHIQDIHQVEEAQKNIASIITEVVRSQETEVRITATTKSVIASEAKQSQVTRSFEIATSPSAPRHDNLTSISTLTSSVIVGLEGASGPFNLGPYREYTGPVIAKAIAGYLLKEGYIGGPEFAGLTAPQPPLLWGVEEKQLYDNNVRAFKDSLKYKPQAEALLGKLKAAAESLKEHIYSKELKEFDSHFNAYKNDQEKLGAYVRYLQQVQVAAGFSLRDNKERKLKLATTTTPDKSGNYNKMPLNVVAQFTGGKAQEAKHSRPLGLSSFRIERRYPNLNLLERALTLEEHLNFNKVDKERQELVTLMVKQLSEKQLDHLLKQSLTYRMGGMSYSQYYEFLRSFCHKNQVPFDTFSQLKSYVTYVKAAERINRNKLFDELTALEENVQNLLAHTTEQKHLVTASRNLLLLEKLTSHQMTPQDWNYYESNRKSILVSLDVIVSAAQVAAGFSLRTSNERKLKLATTIDYYDTNPNELNELFTPYEDFCRHAMERNTALVDNLLLKVQQSSNPPSSPFSKGGKKGITLSNSTLASTSVLIAGGFHSDGLTQILKTKDISYVVVTPKITEVPKDTHYLDVFAHDPTPLEKLFTGEVISLSPHLVFNGINPDDFRGQIAHGLWAGLRISAKLVGKDRELKEVTASKQIKEEFITTLQKEAVNVAGSLGFESITVDDFIWESGYFLGALVTVTTGGKTISFWSVMTEGEKLDAFEHSIRKQGKEIETKRIVAEGKLDINGEVGFHIYNANHPVSNRKLPATVRSFVNNKYLRHAIVIHEGAAWLLARILSTWTKTKPEKIQISGSKPGVLVPNLEQHPIANFIVSLGHPLVNLALAFVPFAVAYFYGLPDTVTWQAFWAVYLLTMLVPNAIVGGYNLIIYRITGSDGWRALHPGTTPPTPWIRDMNSVLDRVKIGLNWLANIVPGLNVINISTRTDDSKIIRMMLQLLENISGASGMNTSQFWVQYGAFAHHEAYRAAELYVEAHNAVFREHGSIRTDGKYLELVLSKLGEKLQEHALDLVTPKIPQGQQIIQIKEPRLLDLLLGRWIFGLGRLKAIQIPKPDQSVNNVDGLAQEVLGDEDAPDVKRMFIEILGQIKNDNISLVSSDKKSKTWDKESLRRLLLFVRDVLEILNEVPEGILNKSSRKMPLTIESLQFHGMIGRGGVIKISVKPHEAGKRGIVIDVGSDGVTDKTELRDTVIHETLGHKLTFMDNRDVLDDFVLPLRSWMGIAQLIVGESLARSFTTDFVKRNTDLLEKTGKADSLFVKVTEAIAYALTDHAESPYVRGMDGKSKFKEIRTILSSDLLVDKHGKHWEFIGGRNGGWREVALIKPSIKKPGSGRQNSLRQQAYELLRQHMQYVVRYNEGYSNASIDDWRMVLRALKQYRPNYRLDIQKLLTNEMLLQEFVNTFYKVFKEAKNITGDPYVDSTINHRKMLELLEKQQGAPSRNGWVDFDPIFRLLNVTNQVHRKVISSVIEALGLNIPVAEGWISKLAGMPILLPLEVHKEVLAAVGFVVSGAHEIPQGLKDEIPELEGAITNAIDKANKDFGITINAGDIQIIRSPPSKSGGRVGKISKFLSGSKSNVVNGLKDVPTHKLLFWTTDGKIMIHEDVLKAWNKENDPDNLINELTETIHHEYNEFTRNKQAMKAGLNINTDMLKDWHNKVVNRPFSAADEEVSEDQILKVAKTIGGSETEETEYVSLENPVEIIMAPEGNSTKLKIARENGKVRVSFPAGVFSPEQPLYLEPGITYDVGRNHQIPGRYTSVSRNHLELTLRNDGLLKIVDTKSSYGTHIQYSVKQAEKKDEVFQPQASKEISHQEAELTDDEEKEFKKYVNLMIISQVDDAYQVNTMWKPKYLGIFDMGLREPYSSKKDALERGREIFNEASQKEEKVADVNKVADAANQFLEQEDLVTRGEVAMRSSAKNRGEDSEGKNEDAIYVDADLGFILVADGMGGHAAGRKASHIAKDVASEHIAKNLSEAKNVNDVTVILKDAAYKANGAILNYAVEHPEARGLGTTLSMAILWKDKEALWVVGLNIGDSRLYIRASNGDIVQISKDDSIVQQMVDAHAITPEQAEVHDRRNEISKALDGGTLGIAEHNVIIEPIKEDDIVFAISDGVSDNLGNKGIAETAKDNHTPSDLVKDLVQEASKVVEGERKGLKPKPDDITAAAIRPMPAISSASPPAKKATPKPEPIQEPRGPDVDDVDKKQKDVDSGIKDRASAMVDAASVRNAVRKEVMNIISDLRFGKRLSLVGQIPGLTPKMEKAFSSGQYAVADWGEIPGIKERYHLYHTFGGDTIMGEPWEDIGLSPDSTSEEKKAAYIAFMAWQATQVGFPEGNLKEAEEAFLKEFEQPYGIKLLHAVSAGQVYYIMEILRLLPQRILQAGVIRIVDLQAGRDKAARFAQYVAERGEVGIIMNPIKFDRYLLTAFLVHEFGHAVMAALTDEEMNVLELIHQDFLKADAIFGVDFMGMSKEARISYISGFVSEFSAENYMHFIILGESGMVGAKDRNQELRRTLFNFYAGLYATNEINRLDVPQLPEPPAHIPEAQELSSEEPALLAPENQYQAEPKEEVQVTNINDVETFSGLYDYINFNVGNNQVKGGDAGYWTGVINDVRKGEAGLANITRGNDTVLAGLRDKVAELLINDINTFDELYNFAKVAIGTMVAEKDPAKKQVKETQLESWIKNVERVREGKTTLESITSLINVQPEEFKILKSKIKQLVEQQSKPKSDGPSLFGVFGLKSVIRAAVQGEVDTEVLIAALESAKNMVKDNGVAHGFFDNLLKSVNSGNVTPNQIMRRLLMVPAEAFLILPSELFEAALKAAGFAVENLVAATARDSLHQEAKDIVEQFQEKVGADVKPENVHVIRGPPVKGLNNKKFVTFARDAKGALHIYVHKDTLLDWEREERRFTNNPPQPSFRKGGEKGSGYLRNALTMALWHETLENRGVSHDDLANMGFTIDALNEMYKAGLTAEQIHAEIMRRGMMELSHLVKVEVQTSPSVSKKEKAEEILQALIKGKHPQPLLTHTVHIGGLIVALDGERKAQKERFLNLASTLGEPVAKIKVRRNDAETREYNDFLRAVDYMDSEELSEGVVIALAEQSAKAKSDFRQELAQSLARDITNALNIANNETELIALIKRASTKLGLLHTLGGSLFQGNIMEKKKSLSLKERALNQQRDLALISQIPFLAGHLNAETNARRKKAAREMVKVMNSYNEARQRVVRINSAYQFLDASLDTRSSNGMVVQVSKNMLEAKGELSGVEQTGLNLLIGFANRLDENGNILVDRNITLVVKDDEGKGMSTETILNALNKRVANSGIKSDLTRLSSLAGSLIVNAQSPLVIDGKISIKGLIELLRKERRLKDNQGLDIFALNEKDWARDVTEKEAIVNLIVMLAGDLAHVITPIETEGRKQTYLKIQA